MCDDNVSLNSQVKSLIAMMAVHELAEFVRTFRVPLSLDELSRVVMSAAKTPDDAVIVRIGLRYGWRLDRQFSKISLIKFVRHLTDWTLRDAKEWVDELTRSGGVAREIVVKNRALVNAAWSANRTNLTSRQLVIDLG